MHETSFSYVFFGTSEFAVFVLEELKNEGLLPGLIVTMPDKPKGRRLALASSPVKVWALSNNITFLQPEKLDETFNAKLKNFNFQLGVVASYGKIIPDETLNIPKRKTLNIHPSPLPRLRGPSPIQTAILEEEKTGVTIIRLDSEMDHGPIVAQKVISPTKWPTLRAEHEEKLAKEGARLLISILPDWVSGEAKETSQDERKATYTKKIVKEDGLIDLSDEPEKNWRRFLAYSGWPGVYFFASKGQGSKIRVVIKEAEFKNGIFSPIRVIPEGKKEMTYEDFLRGIK